MTDKIINIVDHQRSIEVEFGALFRDAGWFREGDELAVVLARSTINSLKLKLGQTCWGDPLSLLSFYSMLREFASAHPQATIEFDLGASRRDGNRFPAFLANQGFLRLVPENTIVRWETSNYRGDELKALETGFKGLENVLAFQNADCIKAKLFDTATLQRALTDVVESLVAEAHDQRISRWLPNSRQRGFLLQKLRVLLNECLDNIREHAYESSGYAGVYARIRTGLPEDADDFLIWNEAYTRERSQCPCLVRSNCARRPGWIELFVCDTGVGLSKHLSVEATAPLFALRERLFREPVSRYADRSSAGKTQVTGLQHIGQILQGHSDDGLRGDFVRLYSDGEWLGEHLPWPVSPLSSAHASYRNSPDSSPVPGTAFHFAIEPPSADIVEQRKLYPDQFFLPEPADLMAVREALSENETPKFLPHSNFVDLYVGADSAVTGRGPAALTWIESLHSNVVVIRPSRALRKIDLLDQLEKIRVLARPPVEKLIFADVPTSVAIDFANVLRAEKLSGWWPTSDLRLAILSQDWACAVFTLGADRKTLVPNRAAAMDFVRASVTVAGAALVAVTLRERDTSLFWGKVDEAFLREPVVWQRSRDGDLLISGYLDLPSALTTPDCYDASRRALRRAVAAFSHFVVVASDNLVLPLIDPDFSVLGVSGQSSERPTHAVLVSSVTVTGSTVARFQAHDSFKVVGIAHLARHPDSVQRDSEDTGVIALRWNPVGLPFRKPRRNYERIPNSSFIVRGGERAVPLPRFATPRGSRPGRSFYGDTPNEAYGLWQRLGIMRIGHWTHNLHHDLLSVDVGDAIAYDSADQNRIVPWITDLLLRWQQEAARSAGGFAVAFPRHRTTDALVRILKKTLVAEKIAFFPLQFASSALNSPLMINPFERERLGLFLIQTFRKGGILVHLDDVVISGRTITQYRQMVEALWRGIQASSKPPSPPSLDMRSIALLDRSGLPTQRTLVEKMTKTNPRLWRWDVPTLGQEGTCPLCAVLDRCNDFASRAIVQQQAIRIREWVEFWRPVPIEDKQADHGLAPIRLPPGDSTRFCIERSEKGIEVAHQVEHLVSTSRAAIAAEICCSTTRKDYPLVKVLRGTFKNGRPFDLHTKIEVLASHILLFLAELPYLDRVERLRAMLDLLWAANDGSPHTSLAALTSLADPATYRQLWKQCCTLVDAAGFPSDDALYTAVILYKLSGSESPGRRNHKDWGLFQLLTAPSALPGALRKLFQIFGWDSNSVHHGLLLDLLQKKVAGPNDVIQVTLILESLSEALRELVPELLEDFDLDPKGDASGIREMLASLYTLPTHHLPFACEAESGLLGLRLFAAACSTNLRLMSILRQRFDEIYKHLFIDTSSMRSRYKNALTIELSARSGDGELLLASLRDLLAKWPNMLRGKNDAVLTTRWGDKTPLILFCREDWRHRPIYAYRDALVRRGLTDLMSNVVHRDRAISCPWPEHESHGEADMWIKIEPIADQTRLKIEMANGAEIAAGTPRIGQTANTIHLLQIGGTIQPTFDKVRRLLFTRVEVPTMSGLAWEEPK